MPLAKDNVRVSIKLSNTQNEKLTKLAKSNSRSKSNMIAHLIQKWVDSPTPLPEAPQFKWAEPEDRSNIMVFTALTKDMKATFSELAEMNGYKMATLIKYLLDNEPE